MSPAQSRARSFLPLVRRPTRALSPLGGSYSLVDAGAVELSAASGSTVFDIRAGIIADQAALRALQQYVREVCLR